MKATESFKKIINDHLQERAANDPLFAITLAKKNKSIDECVNYIFSEVQKSGCHGFDDDEIFQMAVHYYDEDSIKDVKSVSGQVVVNRSIPATKSKSEPKQAETPKPAVIKKLKPVITNQPSLF